MLYYSWDMGRDGCNYFSFWAIFCLFTPLTAWKFKILKKWKKELEISSFYTSVPKMMVICCTVPEIWCMTYVIVIFHFRLFFALSLLNSLKNQNFKKMKKTPGDIIILHMCTVPKIMIRWCAVPEIWCATEERMDRRTDRKSDM